MPYIHVLDLAQDGVIKPHVDSSRVNIYMYIGMILIQQLYILSIVDQR